MGIIVNCLTGVMDWCYRLCGNYGIAIVLFTFLSKVILLPVTLWTYFNSIKMIRIQPDINLIKVKYFGQPDQIGEEQNKLFKREGYNPFISTVPLIIQLVLLMAVVDVIKAGIGNPGISMDFLGQNLGSVPSRTGISLLWAPILAGLSSFIMCMAQNHANVLQAEQSFLNKYGTMIFSVGLSLYLGWFVSLGTCLYWICSNLFAVVQLYVMNFFVRPRRFIDYEKLEDSRRQMAELASIAKEDKKEGFFSENRKRERRDYKRFFSVENKHLVFYAEGKGFYKYFKGLIEYLLDHSKITIHYITSDPEDGIFAQAEKNPRIRAYYIGTTRLITLFMKMDADVVVMTTPDLENYQLKRSYVRKDIKYVYIPHGMTSPNLQLHKEALDHFDVLYCTGRAQVEEFEAMERVRNLPVREKVQWGYSLLDEIRRGYEAMPKDEGGEKKILIAPSWGKDNIMDTCIDALVASLTGHGWHIIVRPHPQFVRHRGAQLDQLAAKYAAYPDVEIQTDFSSNDTVYGADLMITDWSSIVCEYAYATCKPILFINTPMKVMNPEYEKIGIEPIDIWIRSAVGTSLEVAEADRAAEAVGSLLEKKDEYHDRIDSLAHEYVYNLGCSDRAGAEALLSIVRRVMAEKKAE